MTNVEKIEVMYRHFGKTEGKICRNCSHVVKNDRSRTYNKCGCYGLSSSEATDFPMMFTACGLFNKDTDVTDIYKGNRPHKQKDELQPETLFEV